MANSNDAMVKTVREESQLQSVIHELHQATEDIASVIHDMRNRLEPVLLSYATDEAAEVTEPDKSETCSVGRDIRVVVERVRLSRQELERVMDNLDV